MIYKFKKPLSLQQICVWVFLYVFFMLNLMKPAEAAVCSNSKDIIDNINYDITHNISILNNQLGSTFDITKNAGVNINVAAICPSGVGVNYTYRSYISPYSVIDRDGNYQYVKLNDYLKAAISIKDSYAGTFYPPAQYIHMGNDSRVSKNKPFSVNDSDLKFRFKLIKSFVGSVNYELNPAFYVYVTTTDTDPLNKVVYTISYSGKMIVPQSCEINAGQVINMDFGNIAAPAFSQAGAGNKPAGVNPQTRSVGIKCKNIDAEALLSLRIEADKINGNALVSDNPDLGFVIADSKYKVLTPNNINSKIPFRLDDNASASVPVSAWPVSVTGNKPVAGRFTSEGYVRVDFD